MPSINLIKASDGTGNASTATVQTVRNSGVTTIIVDTVNNIPATFMGSMGTPHTFVDPVTSEEITVISEATAVDFTGHVSGANLEIDSIAPGYTDLGSAVSDIIVIRPTTDWANNIATVLAVAHSDTGAITTDTIAEKTAANGVAVDGLNIKDGKLNTANSVVATNITDGIITNAKLSTTAGEIGGAWVAFIPSFTNFVLGNGTVAGARTQVGKTVKGRIQITCGSTTSFGLDARIAFPVTPHSFYTTPTNKFIPLGSATYHDNGNNIFFGTLFADASTAAGMVMNVFGAVGTYATRATTNAGIPFTIAAGDTLSFTFEYEAA